MTDEAVRIRNDEFAEMELRILVALYDAGADARNVRHGEVYRPAGRYTGPDDAPAVMKDLLAGRVTGRLGPAGLLGARLEPATRASLDEADARGVPWIARARSVIAEACRPVAGHAAAVRDALRG